MTGRTTAKISGFKQFGPRLTVDEYEKRIFELQQQLPAMPTIEQDREARHKQLNLAIDHRLGCNFPVERREALWRVQQRLEKKRLRLGLTYLLGRFFHPSNQARKLARKVVSEYAKVLNEAELTSFLNPQKNQGPSLPVDHR